jgi:hypothetical protein
MLKTIIFFIILVILILKKNKNINLLFNYNIIEHFTKNFTNKINFTKKFKNKINLKFLIITLGFFYIFIYSKQKILILLFIVIIFKFYSNINFFIYNIWNIKNNKFFINKFILI